MAWPVGVAVNPRPEDDDDAPPEVITDEAGNVIDTFWPKRKKPDDTGPAAPVADDLANVPAQLAAALAEARLGRTDIDALVAQHIVRGHIDAGTTAESLPAAFLDVLLDPKVWKSRVDAMKKLRVRPRQPGTPAVPTPAPVRALPPDDEPFDFSDTVPTPAPASAAPPGVEDRDEKPEDDAKGKPKRNQRYTMVSEHDMDRIRRLRPGAKYMSLPQLWIVLLRESHHCRSNDFGLPDEYAGDRMGGCSRSVVIRARKQLEEIGMLHVHPNRRCHGVAFGPTYYTLKPTVNAFLPKKRKE